jgi:hypothetical protein
MLCIPKQHQAAIKAARIAVAKRQKAEDKEYKAFIKKMGIAPGTWEDDVLWDHIYNGSDMSVFYSKT